MSRLRWISASWWSELCQVAWDNFAESWAGNGYWIRRKHDPEFDREERRLERDAQRALDADQNQRESGGGWASDSGGSF